MQEQSNDSRFELQADVNMVIAYLSLMKYIVSVRLRTIVELYSYSIDGVKEHQEVSIRG